MNKLGHEAQLRAFPTPGYLGFDPHFVLPFSFETVPLLRRAQFLQSTRHPPREVLSANQDAASFVCWISLSPDSSPDRYKFARLFLFFSFLGAGWAVQNPPCTKRIATGQLVLPHIRLQNCFLFLQKRKIRSMQVLDTVSTFCRVPASGILRLDRFQHQPALLLFVRGCTCWQHVH